MYYYYYINRFKKAGIINNVYTTFEENKIRYLWIYLYSDIIDIEDDLGISLYNDFEKNIEFEDENFEDGKDTNQESFDYIKENNWFRK